MAAAFQQATQPLPPGWDSKYDAASRRYYFINHATQQTTWQDPRSMPGNYPTYAPQQQYGIPMANMAPTTVQATPASQSAGFSLEDAFTSVETLIDSMSTADAKHTDAEKTRMVNQLKSEFTCDEAIIKSTLVASGYDKEQASELLKRMGFAKAPTGLSPTATASGASSSSYSFSSSTTSQPKTSSYSYKTASATRQGSSGTSQNAGSGAFDFEDTLSDSEKAKLLQELKKEFKCAESVVQSTLAATAYDKHLAGQLLRQMGYPKGGSSSSSHTATAGTSKTTPSYSYSSSAPKTGASYSYSSSSKSAVKSSSPAKVAATKPAVATTGKSKAAQSKTAATKTTQAKATPAKTVTVSKVVQKKITPAGAAHRNAKKTSVAGSNKPELNEGGSKSYHDLLSSTAKPSSANIRTATSHGQLPIVNSSTDLLRSTKTSSRMPKSTTTRQSTGVGSTRSGPNPSLLLSRRSLAIGPNRLLACGPQRRLSVGPSHCARGRCGIAQGPDRRLVHGPNPYLVNGSSYRIVYV